jgi:hypothetical protein
MRNPKDWLFLRRQDTTLLLVNLFLCALTTYAQNADWDPGTTSDWNTAANWTPATVPTEIATFGAPGVKSITFSQPTTIGTLQFNAPGYGFEMPFVGLPSTLTFTGSTGSGVESTPANAPTFNVPGGFVFFMNGSTAGPAIFTTPFINEGEVSRVEFFDTSTARTGEIY